MKLHGYCTECRRPKLVRVSGHGLAMLAASKGRVAQGVCDDCEQKLLPGGRRR